MARRVEDLRASNVPAPVLVEAAEKRCLNHQAPDLIGRRKERADHLAALRQYMPLRGKPVAEVHERDLAVTMRDGAQIRVRLYTSNNKEQITSGGPLILMFHEGGFAHGDLTDEEMNCRLFARDFGAVCGNVEYRLVPEHPWPTWINDSVDVTKYFAKHAKSLQADPSKGFIVGGSSAGGNIAAVLAQLSRLGEFEVPVTGQYLSVPLIFPLELVPDKYKDELLSPYENTNDPVLRYLGAERLTQMIGDLKIDSNSNLFTPLASPSYPPDAVVSKYPLGAAYMQVGGLDPLRDHALVYDRILREEYNTESKVDLYNGFGHMFWTNWPELQESQNFVADTVKGIAWLLEHKPRA